MRTLNQAKAATQWYNIDLELLVKASALVLSRIYTQMCDPFMVGGK
ncbi:MAG: hypothetical protein P1S60_03530 [Anaerolineae bacterium]|nr:hypothetical protein [Anaerolineae bacterium]